MADGRIDHYYRVLGVRPSASSEELKRAHRDLAQVWHPDRFMANPRLRKVAQEKLLEINEAYDALRSGAPLPPPDARPAVEEPRTPPAVRQPRHWFDAAAQAAAVAF